MIASCVNSSHNQLPDCMFATSLCLDRRKQGLLRRPAAPHIADAPTLSAKQLLQETRPYVPKPLTVVPPDRHRLEASEDALQSLSKKIMSSPDEELKADEVHAYV